ncbi:MAG TPA: EAL domain-containing protein [Actinomycetota bacterium]
MAPERAPVDQPIERIRGLLRGTALDMEFQPIFDLNDGRVVGVEALARFRMQPLRSPDAWFREAAAVGLGVDVEMAAVQKALSALPHIPFDSFLSLNASPNVITSDRFFEKVVNRAADRVVIEVKEAALAREPEAHAAFDRLRRSDIRVAVDDVRNDGATFSNILRMAPNFVKLDLSLCRYIDLDLARFEIVRALVDEAEQSGAEVIAEGIQSRSELEALRRLGVRQGQGYYLALPGKLPLRTTTAFADRQTVRVPDAAVQRSA